MVKYRNYGRHGACGDQLRVPKTTMQRLKHKLKSKILPSSSTDTVFHFPGRISVQAPAQSPEPTEEVESLNSEVYESILSITNRLFPQTQEAEDENASPLLFEGSRVSERESSLLLLSFAIRYKLSDTGLSDLLNLVNFHMPEGATVPPSVHLLHKNIGTDYSQIIKNYYCKTCNVLLADCITGKCSCGFDSTHSGMSGNFFITFDFKLLLENMLKRKEIAESLRRRLIERKTRREGVWEDIWDGVMYKSLNLGDNDLTCCLNTDGISVFKKSTFKLWPILLSLNELDYKLRKKHTVLAGLWFGDKPNFHLFLKPLVAQSRARVSVKWLMRNFVIESQVFFPICAADSPARCQCQSINQFNGEYSCHWCLVQGTKLVNYDGEWVFVADLEPGTLGRGVSRKRVFDPSVVAEKRNETTHLEHINEFREKIKMNPKLKNLKGVKGASQLLLVPKFHIIEGFVFDYMHTILIGCLEMITMLFLETSNHMKPFYLGRKRDQINKNIRQFKPPSETSRRLRELDDIAHWKANEWKQWFWICIPVLTGILDEPYLSHLDKFITGVSLLLQNRIVEQDLQTAESLIQQFCRSVPNLYGLEYCSFNLHILTHAAKCVRDWGPLWCYSLFQFESFNGILTNSFSGTAKVGMQIARRYLRAEQVVKVAELGMPNSVAKHFCGALLSGKNYYSQYKKCGSATFLGPSKSYLFSSAEIHLMGSFGIHAPEGMSYKRCIINRKLFSSYSTKFRCNNVFRAHGKFYLVRNLLAVESSPFGFISCQYLSTVADGTRYSWKVTYVSNLRRLLTTNDVDGCKFIVRFEGESIKHIVQLLCEQENE